jgi:hypothetical protein
VQGASATYLKKTHTKEKSTSLDLAFASSFQQAGAVALSWQKLAQVQFIKSEHFFVGYGLRFTSNGAQNKAFVTAPGKVSEGNFFKKQNEDKLDTLFLTNSNTNSINLAIYLGYQISHKFMLEFNIDAVGFTFGGAQSGSFNAFSQGQPITTETAKVTPLNLLLTGDYDWGSLNSEFTLNYRLNNRWSLRPGVSFVFSEYTTDRKLTFNNDRFRNKALYPVLGVRYQL